MANANRNPNRPRGNVVQPANKRASAYSYYANRTPRDDSPRRDKEEITNKRIPINKISVLGKIIILIAILIGIIICGNMLWLNNSPKIDLLSNTSTKPLLQSSRIYQKAASKELSNSITSHTKVTINSSEISKHLRAQFPELANVNVVLPIFGHQLTFVLQEASPTMVLASNNINYLLEAGGRVIASRAGELTPYSKLNIPIIASQSNTNYHVNQQALSLGDINFIVYLYGQFQNQHVSISSALLVINSRELDIHINNHPYFIKFNLEEDPKEEVGTFLAVYQQLIKNKTQVNQYIDVRIPGRVYYK